MVSERTRLKPKLNIPKNLWKGLGSPVIDVSVKELLQFVSLCS